MAPFDSSNTIFQTAISFVNQTDKHLFLTGKAGTGKTTFLKYIQEHSFKKMTVVAPTGVAAINAGGVTIHSLFQIPPGTYLPSQGPMLETFDGKIYNNHTLFRQMRMSADKKELLRELELLIIDEISMVRADLLDAIDAVLRHVRKQPLIPFGGVQVLYIGDLFQLPPVAINHEWSLLKNFYQSPFFFDAQVIQQMPPVYIELKKIYRQTDDVFINILNNIRNNCCTDSDLSHLHKYFNPGFELSPGENFITLTTHNDKAVAINNAELRKLPGKLHKFSAQVSGEFNERSFPGEHSLQLKKGAQVMFVKNDSGESRRYYNGKIGIVQAIDEKEIQIAFPGETTLLTLEKEIWKNIRYHYDKVKDSVHEEELGTFTQYPIRLAWAITIHKSQGLTFEKAIIDAGDSFAAGQVYVALSRLVSLKGLVLKSRIQRHCIHTDERVLGFVSKELPEDVLHQTLKEEQQNFIYSSLLRSFRWDNIAETLREHIDQYEHRKLPELNACVTWAKEMLEKTKVFGETSSRFQTQLEKLFEHCKQDNYKQLHERISAATNYFLKETDEKILVSLDDHIETMKIKKNTKKYVRELFELKNKFQRRKLQLKNTMTLSALMLGSGNTCDLLKAAEELQRPIAINAEVEKTVKKKVEKGETQRISLQMFKKGKSIADISGERNLAFSTIEGHLAGFIATGEVEISSLVDDTKLEKICRVIEQNPSLTSSSEVKRLLGDDVTYGQVRAVMSYKNPRSEVLKTD